MRLSLTCADLGVSAAGWIEADVAELIFGDGASRELTLMHAKRDGEACFAFLDELTGLDGSGQTRGRPGEVFAFGGDPTRGGRERVGQLVFVYGDDNLFVEPLETGLVERQYRRVGAIEDVAALAELGGRVWRHGARRIELTVVDG